MSGITASYLDQYDEAITHLGALLEQGQPPLPGEEDSLVNRYLSNSSINIQITQFTIATLPLDMTAALFLYVELLQLAEQVDAATEMIEDVFRQNPDFRLAQLSLICTRSGAAMTTFSTCSRRARRSLKPRMTLRWKS